MQVFSRCSQVVPVLSDLIHVVGVDIEIMSSTDNSFSSGQDQPPANVTGAGATPLSSQVMFSVGKLYQGNCSRNGVLWKHGLAAIWDRGIQFLASYSGSDNRMSLKPCIL